MESPEIGLDQARLELASTLVEGCISAALGSRELERTTAIEIEFPEQSSLMESTWLVAKELVDEVIVGALVTSATGAMGQNRSMTPSVALTTTTTSAKNQEVEIEVRVGRLQSVGRGYLSRLHRVNMPWQLKKSQIMLREFRTYLYQQSALHVVSQALQASKLTRVSEKKRVELIGHVVDSAMEEAAAQSVSEVALPLVLWFQRVGRAYMVRVKLEPCWRRRCAEEADRKRRNTIFQAACQFTLHAIDGMLGVVQSRAKDRQTVPPLAVKMNPRSNRLAALRRHGAPGWEGKSPKESPRQVNEAVTSTTLTSSSSAATTSSNTLPSRHQRLQLLQPPGPTGSAKPSRLPPLRSPSGPPRLMPSSPAPTTLMMKTETSPIASMDPKPKHRPQPGMSTLQRVAAAVWSERSDQAFLREPEPVSLKAIPVAVRGKAEFRAFEHLFTQ